jgi:hypothetical protein
MPRKTIKELEAEWEESRLKDDGLSKEAYIRMSRHADMVNEHQAFMDDVSTVGWGRACFNAVRRKIR